MNTGSFLKSLDERFMAEAFKMAQKAFECDEVPVGAVIIHKNQLIAKAHNQVETLKDPTAHAEMIAVTQAANALSQKWLEDCTMYVTLEPCAMCAGALVLSRIKRLVFGAKDPKAGACGSVMNITHHPSLNHVIEIEGGLLENECAALMSEFFERKRLTKKSLEKS
ncbi:MAG TPA: tRNA adenosine(34) deaminase TadA [Candidatus Omnitrophota bacterium]|nr:tRNA adenosine(34) deaminase TadA [Candidatus Omnitrophota bacterium]